MFIIMPSQFGTGFQVPTQQVKAFVRGGSKVRGQVVEFDFANSDTATTDDNMDGGDNSGFGNVIATTTASATSRMKLYGIVEGPGEGTAGAGNTVADDALAIVTLYGVTRALVFDATGALAKDDDLFVVAGASPGSATGLVDTDATFVIDVEYRIVGKCLETVADADPEILASVWFWGGLPFGVRQNAAA
jgi:hypothetical protein